MSSSQPANDTGYPAEAPLIDELSPYLCPSHRMVPTIRIVNMNGYRLPDGVEVLDIFATQVHHVKTWYKGSKHGPWILWQCEMVRQAMVAQSCRECAYISISSLQSD